MFVSGASEASVFGIREADSPVPYGVVLPIRYLCASGCATGVHGFWFLD